MIEITYPNGGLMTVEHTEEPEIIILSDGQIVINGQKAQIKLSPIELRRIRDKCNDAINQIVGDPPGGYH